VTAISTDGQKGAASIAYTVAGAPSITISSPAAGVRFAIGQRVAAAYGCQDGASGPGILSCSGSAPNGKRIATSTPGTHSFKVTATSLDGQSATKTVTYNVALPSNRMAAHPKAKLLRHGAVLVTVKVPGPGTVSVLITAPNAALPGGRATDAAASRSLVYARARAVARHAMTLKITVKPDAKGRRVVAHHPNPITLSVFVTYTPTLGRPGTVGPLSVRLR
jgi:hypothetical protein